MKSQTTRVQGRRTLRYPYICGHKQYNFDTECGDNSSIRYLSPVADVRGPKLLSNLFSIKNLWQWDKRTFYYTV